MTFIGIYSWSWGDFYLFVKNIFFTIIFKLIKLISIYVYVSMYYGSDYKILFIKVWLIRIYDVSITD